MLFKENLNRICKEKGTSISKMLSDLGISTSKVTSINNGHLPSEEMIVSFAKYLNCHVMDFFDDGTPIVVDNALSDDEKDILEYYRGLDRREQHIFMSKIYEK